MFTGIIQGHYPVTELVVRSGLTSFSVHLPEELILGLSIGASVAINGVCLTVVKVVNNLVSFDVMAETLKVTTLSELQIDQLVNIERSLRFGDEIGGHLLSGHVDTMAQIIAIEEPTNNYILTLQVLPSFMEFILPRGYVGLHGASLTVVNPIKANCTFQVSLIPETLKITNLQTFKVGSNLNLEIDRQTQAIVLAVKDYLRTTNLY